MAARKKNDTIILKVNKGVSDDDLKKLLATLEPHAVCERLFPGHPLDDEISDIWRVTVPPERYKDLLADLPKSPLIEYAEAPTMRELISSCRPSS